MAEASDSRGGRQAREKLQDFRRAFKTVRRACAEFAESKFQNFWQALFLVSKPVGQFVRNLQRDR